MLTMALIKIVVFLNWQQCVPPRFHSDGMRHNIELIDDLANRNQSPKLVESKRAGQDTVPLFPPEYDWKEQKRVDQAWKRLWQNESHAVWESLLRNGHDNRYALTVENSSEFAENLTVGRLCRYLAQSRLLGFIQVHEPTVPGSERKRMRLIELDWDKIVEWRKARKHKQLYELQIELCSDAINKMENASKLPAEIKEKIKKNLIAELAQLKSQRRPIQIRGSKLEFRLYTPEEAKRIDRENRDRW